MRSFGVKLAEGSRHVWEVRGGPDTCERYSGAQPGVTVVAWRAYPRVGVFVWGGQDVVDPGYRRHGYKQALSRPNEILRQPDS